MFCSKNTGHPDYSGREPVFRPRRGGQKHKKPTRGGPTFCVARNRFLADNDLAAEFHLFFFGKHQFQNTLLIIGRNLFGINRLGECK